MQVGRAIDRDRGVIGKYDRPQVLEHSKNELGPMDPIPATLKQQEIAFALS